MLRCRAVSKLATLAALRFLTITPIPMPALSPTMEKGKITEWCKQPGDFIRPGDTFCNIETDKAVVSYDNATEEGFFARVITSPGEETVVGQTVCLIVDEKEGVHSDEVKNWKPEAEEAPAAAAEEAPAAPAATTPVAAAPVAASGDRVKASPYARKMAAEKNVSLRGIKGTGGGVGRITSKDVAAAVASGTASSAAEVAAPAKTAATAALAAPAKPAAAKGTPPANPNFTDIPVTTMRSVIAKRLHQSKNLEIPHYYLFDDCRVDNMLALIKQLNAKGNGEYKITVNDYIVKAVARANTLVPEVNSSWQGDFIRQYATVDVSVAVATPTGLITPIIRNAQAKGLVEISKETKALAKKARDGTLQPSEFQGGTCSVSNLGATGIPGFTAIINPPQAMILAVGSAKPRAEIVKSEETGEFEMTGRVENVVSFSASFDHRIVDGALGAKWFQHFHDAMENPLSLLL
ncbi:putative dihydrolipoamide acetyltransferase precursor [Leishmania major strain Friedlin]|uniref:Dihydrolipoamide acetyltransferase component of pyruvate dehydrogenase complex n=1 Tax=Leishmania major TaxID=5664 RepID=Q4Q1F5_LEIMA|nr:putative dihydrolipoamide acetyltransferase precursor [Leishmania major strain Friedlin]CAG9583799.1 dihydrolipoamide_acetyltransferase_precursor_-_putative [Leishmania major strain Friedlin]CAJ09224.1 putative dihydrolipoamide acetyltransferase precursor [Leishmania major strain Friedlin]|eukprot:XP_001686843.1 putative dihydrolipoamide acetyltransferase precursor [Leishmania major strain Friedlin]